MRPSARSISGSRSSASIASSCPCTFLGLAGHPRRYADITGVNFLAPLHSVHYFITIAAMITITAQFIFLFNFFYSMFAGEKASENPWHATTLEWSIPSPPPFDNFAGHVPVGLSRRLRIQRPRRHGGLHSAASGPREGWQGALTEHTAMPGTITDDIEIIDAGHGGGHGCPLPAETTTAKVRAAACRRIPQRAYFTAIQLALAGIVMFFMALTSSFLVRKGLGDDWVAFDSAARAVVQYAGPARQQRAPSKSRARDLRRGRYGRRSGAGGPFTTALGASVSRRAIGGLAATGGAGRFPGHQSEQQLFLSADGAARPASDGRHRGSFLRGVPALAALAHHAIHRRRSGLHLLALHGRAVAVSIRTSLPGTVNCARDEKR